MITNDTEDDTTLLMQTLIIIMVIEQHDIGVHSMKEENPDTSRSSYAIIFRSELKGSNAHNSSPFSGYTYSFIKMHVNLVRPTFNTHLQFSTFCLTNCLIFVIGSNTVLICSFQ